MIKAVVFDLDGTLYLGESLIEGAVDTIAALERNYQIFYLTNNSGKTRQQIVAKLIRLGFPVKSRNTYCGSYALANYLAEKKFTPIYLIGTEDLKSYLVAQNIEIGYSAPVAAVVVGFDPNLDYGKISTAMEAIGNGAKLVIANADPSYPVENGKRLPGCGAMVGAIIGATNHIPDFCVGKPNTYMLELLCKEQVILPKEICVVGDEPESDIQMANNFQCSSILFDPDNAYPKFSGNRIKSLSKIISLLKEKINEYSRIPNGRNIEIFEK